MCLFLKDGETSASSSSGEKVEGKSTKIRRSDRPAKGRRRSTRVSSKASESSVDGVSRRRPRSERSSKVSTSCQIVKIMT